VLKIQGVQAAEVEFFCSIGIKGVFLRVPATTGNWFPHSSWLPHGQE